MLLKLKIKNVALIPEVEIDFSKNLNVLTGETGAGKSIVLNSLNFILGDKLGKNIIRSGENYARVDAAFFVIGDVLKEIKQNTGLDFENNELLITRILKADGKSECRINGELATVSMLQQVASHLVCIHGQHETDSLLKAKSHIRFLDSFGGRSISEPFGDYLENLAKLNAQKNKLKTFGGSDSERERMLDMLSFQIKEIDDAKLNEKEEEELASFKQRMVNLEKISVAVQTAFNYLDNDNIEKSLAAINSVSNLDNKLQRFYETGKQAVSVLKDFKYDLEGYAGTLEFDEEKFKIADARLDVIKVLKRKYGGSVAEVLKFLARAKADFVHLNQSEDEINKIKSDIESQTKITLLAGESLSEARKTAAKRFETELLTQLKDLGMKDAKIQVSFERHDNLASDGIDNVEFLFSANLGEPVKPLKEIISGGEMSRFMLALKTISARADNVTTFVFDEIDTGISGNVGLEVAKKMAVVAKHKQVIAVTHLASIAAMADNNILIDKAVVGGKTITSVKTLSPQEKIDEVARIMGGGSLETAQQHAIQMIEIANKFKSGI